MAISPKKYQIWDGNYSHSTNYTLSFNTPTNWAFYTQACVKDPYVIMTGTVTINQTERNLTCQDCKPHTCLNTSLFNSNHSYVILCRHLGVWLSLTQNKPWELSPDMHTVLIVLNSILKRSKRFIWLLIAATMGIIAITTTAAVVNSSPSDGKNHHFCAGVA